MKILHYGYGIDVKKVECPHCQSTLEYVSPDIFHETKDERTGVESSIIHHTWYLQCPVCGKQIILKKTDVKW